MELATDGGSPEVLHALGIPLEWAERCEDPAHVGHDGTNAALALRLDWLRANQFSNFLEKVSQLGSYGGGNHFGECEVVRLLDDDRARRTAEVFGLRDGCVGFLSHCGSRGFGHALAIFNLQLRVVAITPAPKPTHGLLASVDHFCESGAIRLSIRELTFGLALDGFGIRAVDLAQGQI